MTTRHHHRLLLVAPVALTGLLVAGCGAGGSATGSSGDLASGGGTAAQRAPSAETALGNTGNTGNAQDPVSHQSVQHRAVISTGSIDLTSSDVGAARQRVDAVLKKEGGRVADENTTTDDHGTVTASHLVVRVPSARFGSAMSALSEVATMRGSARKAEDVTTRVIDVKARIAAERAGVRRLRTLVSSAADLRALLAVERELTTRRGGLDSLRQQRAYLADQSSRATITVDITRRTAPPSPPVKAAGGFLGGLHHGWHALVAVGTGFLLGLGAALPFAVLATLLGIPAWVVVRRVRRTRRPEAPAES
jgi:hypothetical protein